MNYSNEKNELNALCREVNILDRLQRNNKLINVSLSQNNINVNNQHCIPTLTTSIVKSRINRLSTIACSNVLLDR